jgi:hypothetical protein
MRRGLCMFLLPFFYLHTQTNREVLQLNYQDSENNQPLKQARFYVSLKSITNSPISLIGKTIFLYTNRACSGDIIGKHESASTNTVNFQIQKKFFEANKTYYLSAGIMSKDNSKAGYKVVSCSQSLMFKTHSYSLLVDPNTSSTISGSRNTPRTAPIITIEFIDALNLGAPSLRVWNISNNQEKIRVFGTSDCTGDEFSIVSSKVSLNSSKDLHLSTSQFPENKTYTLSAKTDSSSCSNTIQYKKSPPPAPEMTFMMKSPKVGNKSDISFEIINLRKGDSVTIYQNDSTCTKDAIKEEKTDTNRLYLNAILLAGNSSQDGSYKFYAQAKRSDILGPCLGPFEYQLRKAPPLIATLSLIKADLTTTTTPIKSYIRRPKFQITDLAVGNFVDLILGSSCSGRSILRSEKKNNLILDILEFGERDRLNIDKEYIFSAKVTDPMGNTSCSNNFSYTLQTDIQNPSIQLVATQQTLAMTEDTPSFRIGNLATGDKVAIYKDASCKQAVSTERTITESQKTIDIEILALKKAERNVYYAGVYSQIIQNLKCSLAGVSYQYQPTPPTTPVIVPGIDPVYDYIGGGSSTGGGTPPPPDPKIDDENSRILALGSNLEIQPVTNFFVTEIGYSEKEILERTASIKTTLDSDDYKNAADDKKPWLNTDQLVPYVKTKESTVLSIGGHTVNRILYNLRTQYPNLKTYSRIIRDYTELKFTNEEIQKDMINSGFVWLHNLTKSQTIITNQYVVNLGSNSNENYNKITIANSKVNTTAFCDTTIRDLILITSGSTMTYYCSEPFVPAKFYTETYNNVTSKKIGDMTPDPYMSIVYYIKNGMNPYDTSQKDTEQAPFSRLGISSFSSDPQTLENTITDYLENLMTKPEYLYQDSKWALYIKYRLQRDFGLTYSQIKNSYDTFKPSDPAFVNNKEFGRNVCRALVISRGEETINIANKNPNWFPGYKWKSLSDLPDLPSWCSVYGDTIYSNINIMKTVSY